MVPTILRPLIIDRLAHPAPRCPGHCTLLFQLSRNSINIDIQILPQKLPYSRILMVPPQWTRRIAITRKNRHIDSRMAMSRPTYLRPPTNNVRERIRCWPGLGLLDETVYFPVRSVVDTKTFFEEVADVVSEVRVGRRAWRCEAYGFCVEV